MNKKYFIFLSVLIFLLALFFRFFKLTTVPSSLSMDEITFGYSSYSIFKTARDENGKFLPLSFKGIGDYKPPVDVYLKVPFIALFGLNEFSVRAPGAILGSLTAILIIILLTQLGLSKNASLFGGFWVAVSSWHIFYSRAGFEAITALFFLTLAVIFFLKWLNNSSHFFITLSIVSFAISAWSYHAERAFVPIFFILLIFIYSKNFLSLIRLPKRFFLPIIALLIFALPFVHSLIFDKEVQARAENLLITHDPEVLGMLTTDSLIRNDLVITKEFVGQYLNYFNLRFWFWKGLGLTQDKFQDMGIISLIDIPIFVSGLIFFISDKKNKFKKMLYIWFFVGAIPGAFARGGASPIRILIWLPVFAYIVSIGFDELVTKYKWKFVVVYSLLIAVNTIYFWGMYVNNFPRHFSDLWHFGYKETALFICSSENKFNKVILTDKYGLEIPIIKTIPNYYILFYCKVDPDKYQHNKDLYNVEIRQPQWRIDSKTPNNLLIGSPWDFPEGFKDDRIWKKVYFINEKPAFFFVKT